LTAALGNWEQADMLHEFVTLYRDEIIKRCRAKVAARSIPLPSEAEINHGVPMFLDQLVDALRAGEKTRASSADIDKSAGEHGHDLLLKGFTVSQVVHDYGDVCQTITELAVETNAPISAQDFRTLNRCLDEAIASAVTMYTRESDQSRFDQSEQRSNERVGFLIHELRNLVNTALVAFEVLKTGNVGVSGSTGAVLSRSLTALRDLIARSIDDVRLTKSVTNRTSILLPEFIQEVETAARMTADDQGLTFTVMPVEEGVMIEADRQVLAAVLTNLIQNAFKFTPPHSTVTLRVGASAERVLLEVQDECGGLPGESDTKEMFQPFEQRGADRSGLGIGLAFSRWGAEANGGRLYARNMRGKGCVFTVDLPRCPVLAGNPS
jgi:signal transduction histidine kinase